jgi:hypothetical protein
MSHFLIGLDSRDIQRQNRQDQERIANLRVLLRIEKYIARMHIETYKKRLNSAFPAEETTQK